MPPRIAAVLLICALALPVSAQEALTILHTNDLHARFEPVSRYGSACPEADNAAGACLGGSARLATAISDARAAARAAGEAVLLVDAGDQFQGSLFYTHYKGLFAAEMMTRLGYDAMAVGNHEFDDGPDGLRGFLDAVVFPVLMANADLSGEPLLAGRLAGSAVIARGGAPVGVIGIAPEDTAELARPGPGVIFSPPVAAVQAEVDRLSAAGIDRIVLLSHSGYGADLAIARATTGIDVIVGGHSHSLLAGDDPAAAGPYPTMVGDTAVVQAGALGMYLGALRVVFDEAGRVISATGAARRLDAGVAEDPGVKARVAGAARPLEAIRARVVAEAALPIGGAREDCRARECEIGNLVADAMLERVRAQGAEVALQNGGGLRAGIDAGPVTMGEVLTVLPFSNTLSTFRVSGATLLAALENGVSRIEEGAGRFPQVSGLRFSVDAGAPPGSRIRDVTVGDAPLDPERLYAVVSNDYVRNGGDGYTMLRDARDAYDFGPDLADVVAEYLAAGGPYVPYTDGRITIAAE